MSNTSDLVAELSVHNARCVTSEYLNACIFTFRRRAPFCGIALARWSELTRAQALPKSARDLTRVRAVVIFGEWCTCCETLVEVPRACDVPCWRYRAPVALTPGTRLLSEIARTFAHPSLIARTFGVQRDVPAGASACDAVSNAAMRELTARVLTSDEGLRETATACKEALQKATREVSSEYERDDMLAVALRKRGIPLHTARNWIVPSERNASHYFVDSNGSIAGRG